MKTTIRSIHSQGLLPRVIPVCAALLLAVGCDQPEDADDAASLASEEASRTLAAPITPTFEAGSVADEVDDSERGPLRTGARKVTEFAAGGSFDATEQLAVELRGEFTRDDQEIMLSWAELDERGDAADLVDLADETATLRIHNGGTVAHDVELRIVGDTGTTLDRDLGTVTLSVGPGETLEHRVALESVRPDEAGRTGQLRATAQIRDAETGELELTTSAVPLYFRDDAGALVALDADALLADPDRGLPAGARGAEPMDLRLANGEAEPTVVLRAQRWETTDELQLAAHAATPGASAPTGGAPLSLSAAGQTSAAGLYTLCVRFEIETSDSGHVNSRGYTEDYWTSADYGLVVPAYGVRVKVGATTYDTDPTTGCVSFDAASATQNVLVYAFATNANDSFVRMHNAGKATGNYYPGSTFSWYVSGVQFSAGQTTYVAVGDYTPKATTMATLAFANYRYGTGVYSSEYHVGLDAATCVTGHYWTEGNKSYLTIADLNCTNHQTKKFVVAHEYGHAFGSLRNQLFRGAAYHFDATLSGSCPDQSSQPNKHTYTGIEFNFQAMEEGWADFVAAVVFNNKTQVANLTMHGHYEDLEEWNGSDWLFLPGGYLEWNCVPALGDHQYLAGGANESDWTRMLWDIWTNPAQCSPAPSSTDMLRIFAGTASQPNFAHHLGWMHSQDSVDEVIASGQLGACYAQYWDTMGAYNGVDH